MAERIPREFIHELLNRIDVVDIIDTRLPLRKKSSNNYFACCPFHNEKSASFSVSQRKQFYYCFGCGAHGNAIDFLMQFERLNFPEAIEYLAKQAGMEIPREHVAHEKMKENSPDLYQLLTKVALFYQSELRLAESAIQYLKSRGLTGQIAKDFCIGFAPSGWDRLLTHLGQHPTERALLADVGMLIKKEDGHFYDRFRERIMFPIHDRRGRIVGFGGRVIDEGTPKYLNSPETPIFHKGKELYGLYQTLQHQREPKNILVVEGYMDVVALFQHEIRYAVATLGTAVTPMHLQHLLRYSTEIIFCFDGDDAGRRAAWRALEVALPLMQDNLQIRFLFLPEGEDPDSLVRKEGKSNFEKRIADATPLSHFFFQTMSQQADLRNMDGRARFVNLAKKYLDTLPPGIFQQMMLAELAKKARMDPAQLGNTNLPSTLSKPLKTRRPSNLRLAITLLVQHPSLAFNLTEPLPNLDNPGFALLVELMTTIKNYAIATTGVLLEHWRDRKELDLLVKLAQAEHMIPSDGIEKEFNGTLERLRSQGIKDLIEKLLAKAAQNMLTLEEKKLLSLLIQKKSTA